MRETIVSLFLILGALFTLVSALGIIRLHDVYMRMHAITKSSSLATILFVIAMIIAVPGWRVLLGGLLLIAFVTATAPISTHVLARVSFLLGIKMAPGFKRNDLETYNKKKDEVSKSFNQKN
ncbi:MAG: monovalent cation/H(+) antiporter subunit G [Bacteroidetes bacterium]|jgi:multicomponent Na+:H+ antiporter subunit G|nr:monovalent cation/H(+) antiporter subunit G [Bacteroidota bacterium]MBU1579969.1 monovalent cation/H(+) antiporter subunit G [Bacteroidota bacterium]MBU2464807.1 monovalent cation/H(+) antiporter subunit G [Bacteroidota bacterium]MBU2558020.1 monovalent cation/H(+) antiporter subunit G [Bacteroidota bacterium]MDA3942394.1 monovalent cation/H(+) antiporter subunit G [Bacteroidota bacterium]